MSPLILVFQKMKTLEEEEEQSTATTISFPRDIIEDILSILPVKSLLRFRSVSKPWLSLISHPSFTKLHFTRSIAAHRTALLFSAYDNSTRKRHLFSAPHDGGPLTHLLTIDNVYSRDDTVQLEHINGLVCFTFVDYLLKDNRDQAFLVNPSTHNKYKLPHQAYGKYSLGSLFGFDESRNEHKILMMMIYLDKMEIMLFSMSNYSWRKIDVVPPDGSYSKIYSSVCVNSVIHIIRLSSHDIIGFDLRTEKFLTLNTPQAVVFHMQNSESNSKDDIPYLININGCLGVVCDHHLAGNDEMHIWILQDYGNNVWVREIITLPQSWISLGKPLPVDSFNMDNIIFYSTKLRRNNVIRVLIYNKQSRCFKSLRFTFDRRIFCSKPLKFDHIRCYVESMLPL